MQKYLPLGNDSSLRTFDRQNFLKYLFVAGILINIIYSVFLFVSFGPRTNKNDGKALEKYSVLSRENYKEYLSSSNLDFANSSALFNEVENAVKQKNADLNPIGVTYFPAYIPEGTFLYHSNSDGFIPEGLEWVAMDYEFSYNFAHVFRPRRGRGDRKPPPLNVKRDDDDDEDEQESSPPPGSPPPGGPGGPPKHGGPPGGNGRAHLLTFKVTEPLDKLIYLGGASAAKTRTGEMDTQFLLSQMDNYDDFNERVGAQRICDYYNKNGKKLDGVVRLEVGFEIIICDFNDKLQLVQNLTLTNATDILEFPEEKSKEELEDDDDLEESRSKVLDIFENMVGYDHFLSGAYVYNGDPRIYLDFSKMITLINMTSISTDTYTRRIDEIPSNVNDTFLSEMDKILSGPPFDPFHSTNWEVVTHRIVEKFSPILMTLNITMAEYHDNYNAIFNKEDQSISDVTKQLEIIDTLAKNLTAYTYNFIRRYADKHFVINSDEQLKDSLEMMVWDYVHPYQSLKSDADFLIWASITNVQQKIVDILFDLFSIGKEILLKEYVTESDIFSEDLHKRIITAYANLNIFIDDLNWSIFYKCSDVCGYNEICFVPTWGPSPLGWGVNKKLNTHHKTSDGVRRINKDLICLSPQIMLDIKESF